MKHLRNKYISLYKYSLKKAANGHYKGLVAVILNYVVHKYFTHNSSFPFKICPFSLLFFSFPSHIQQKQ